MRHVEVALGVVEINVEETWHSRQAGRQEGGCVDRWVAAVVAFLSLSLSLLVLLHTTPHPSRTGAMLW